MPTSISLAPWTSQLHELPVNVRSRRTCSEPRQHVMPPSNHFLSFLLILSSSFLYPVLRVSSVPWLPRSPMVSWGVLGGVWPAGRGRISFASTLPWGGPICSAVSSAGLPTSRKMRSYWRQSSGGLRG